MACSGLGPEIVFFYQDHQPESETLDWYIKPTTSDTPLIDARNILRSVAPSRSPWTIFPCPHADLRLSLPCILLFVHRPETVESLFLAFRLTGDPIYREHGWKSMSSLTNFPRSTLFLSPTTLC